jgi:pre-mRNA-splicing factor 38B
MSRSALTRQEGNIRERERQAEEIYEAACAEGQRRNTERWGNPSNQFHLNHLLLQNIKASQYFQKICQELHDWNAVIDEIYYRVEHVGVFEVGKVPSTAFCLLLRLLTLNMTPHQLQNTIKHEDSPYIRAIGFLYLRFAGIPTEIAPLIQPHLFDLENEIAIGPSGHRQKKMSMGEYLCRMFGGTTDYFGETSLPRFPVQAERTIAVLVLAAEKILERAHHHQRNQHHRDRFRIQANVRALYSDPDNPPAWYPAVIDRVIDHDPDTHKPLQYPRYIVTFPEYGNTETVTLGEIDLLDDDGDRGTKSNPSPSARHRHGSKKRVVEEEMDLYEQVRARERERVAGKNTVISRPPTTKQSLAAPNHRYYIDCDDDKEDRHRRHIRGYTGAGAQRDHRRTAEQQQEWRGTLSHEGRRTESHMPPKKRTPEEMAAIAEKKRKLLAKYG